MIRSLLEKASRRACFQRSLPTDLGGASIYVTGSAGLKYLFRPMASIDPPLCRLAVECVRPGAVVWDVGSNVGLFTFAAAHLAGTRGNVFAFEADVWLAQLQRRSVAIQPPTSAPVQVVPIAIAGSCDIKTFNIAMRSRASNSLAGFGNSQTGGVAERHTVVSVTLDWLAERLPAPDVIKIDVEGAEFDVLKGACGVLRDKRPKIICEVCAERSAEVTALLKAAGYRLYDGEVPPANRVEVASAPWNTLALSTDSSADGN